MKKLTILILLAIFISNSPAQELTGKGSAPSFRLGAFAGPNFTFPLKMGYSLILEGSKYVAPGIYVKGSIGLSTIFEDCGNNISTYDYLKIGTTDYYQSFTYKLDEYDYAIVPISLGVEYNFAEEVDSHYLFTEIGYNLYSTEVHKTNMVYGAGGVYNTLEQLPPQYRQKAPAVKEDTSFRIGFGAGTRIKVTGGLCIEFRYLFNINTGLVNSHQILAGISI